MSTNVSFNEGNDGNSSISTPTDSTPRRPLTRRSASLGKKPKRPKFSVDGIESEAETDDEVASQQSSRDSSPESIPEEKPPSRRRSNKNVESDEEYVDPEEKREREKTESEKRKREKAAIRRHNKLMKERIQKYRKEVKKDQKEVQEAKAALAKVEEDHAKHMKKAMRESVRVLREINHDRKMAALMEQDRISRLEDYEKRHKEAQEQNMNSLKEWLENGGYSQDEKEQFVPDRLKRSRSIDSAIKDFNLDNHDTIPIRKSAPSQSTYCQIVNASFGQMENHKKEILRFLESHNEMKDDDWRNWKQYKDPYFEFRHRRLDFINKGCLGILATSLDTDLIISSEEQLYSIPQTWNEEYQKAAPPFAEPFCLIDMVFKETDQLNLCLHRPRSSALELEIKETLEDVDLKARWIHLDSLIRKALIILNMTKIHNPDIMHTRVSLLFQFAIEKRKEIFIDLKPREKYQKMRDLLFWLPVHLGDFHTGIHTPEDHLFEPARQIFHLILSEWPAAGPIVEEEYVALRLMEDTLLRLEAFEDPFIDWLPFTTNSVDHLWDKIKKERNGEVIDGFKYINVPATPRMIRSSSFSELTDIVEVHLPRKKGRGYTDEELARADCWSQNPC